MAVYKKPKSRSGFTIAVICALSLERDAVMEMLDEHWDAKDYKRARGDTNTYSVGRIGPHNVVVAQLPGMGTSEAASTAAFFSSSFPNVTLGLVVGVCGGVPTETGSGDIMLGDVIISTEIIDYTFGRQYDNKFSVKDALSDRYGRPNRQIRGFLATMQGKRDRAKLKAKGATYLMEICETEGFESSRYPGAGKDITFPRTYRHKHQTAGSCDVCANCRRAEDALETAAVTATEEELLQLHANVKSAVICTNAEKTSCKSLGCDVGKGQLRSRTTLVKGTDVPQPEVHFGLIGSGNSVLKSGYQRDDLAKQGIIAFEMEGAGVWDNFPTVVMKAVCDYADGHKSKDWQDFAAASAASCMKAFLTEWAAVDDALITPVEARMPTRLVFPVHSTISRTANTLFTGRHDALYELETIIRKTVEDRDSRAPCHIVISGMAGQGKSEICLQLIRRLGNLFWATFWVDVSSESQAETGFLNIGKYLDTGAAPWKEARQRLANEQQPWLLVLDKADDPEMDYAVYYPAGTFGVVLLTSRNPECRRYATQKWLNLEGLPLADAQELLFRTAGISEAQREPLNIDCQNIAKALQQHTLALAQAGTYIARQNCSMKDYQTKLKTQRQQLLTYRVADLSPRHKDIYARFEQSAKDLQESASDKATDALQLLSLIAMYEAETLPVDMFQAAWEGAQQVRIKQVRDRDLFSMTFWHVTQLPRVLQMPSDKWDNFRLQDALALLERYSLLSYASVTASHAVTMHPLVHAWARDRLNDTERYESWLQAACIAALSRQWRDMWLVNGRQLLSHLEAITSWPTSTIFDSEYRTEICRILMNCGCIFREMKELQHFDQLMTDLCMYLDLNFSVIYPEWLDVYQLKASSLYHCGQIKQAVHLYEQTVAIREQTTYHDDPFLLDLQHNLALAYEKNEQIKDAVRMLERVVEIQREGLVDDDSVLLASQQDLARIYLLYGRTTDAVKTLEHVYDIESRRLDDKDPASLALQYDLAHAYLENGKFTFAVRILEHVVTTRKSTLSSDHPTLISSQYMLAKAYKAYGQFGEAVRMLEHVVDIRENTLPDSHPDRLDAQLELGRAYQANGQADKAVSILKHVVKMEEKILPLDDHSLYVSQRALAMAYRVNSQTGDAVRMLEYLFDARDNKLPESHPDRIMTEHDLGCAYQANGQAEKAVRILKHVVEMQGNILPPDNSSLLSSQRALAVAYQDNGQIGDMVSMLEHIFETRSDLLSDHHPHLLESQEDLAYAYYTAGQFRDALRTIAHVVNIRDDILGLQHLSRLSSQYLLSLCLWETGSRERALELMQHVVHNFQLTLDENHPDRVSSKSWLRFFETELENER